MRAPHCLYPPSVLSRNQQTEARLVLRPKPRNYRGNFEPQITKAYLSVLRSKPENHHHGFEAKPRETVTISFKAKTVQTIPVVLRSNH
jgi:hypothetical protein